jgi:hypothetical protein
MLLAEAGAMASGYAAWLRGMCGKQLYRGGGIQMAGL